MDRKCARCEKEFQSPSHLRRHEQRKTPCALIIESHELPQDLQEKMFGCKFCGRRYASQPGLSRHLKTCRIAGTDEGMQLLYTHTLKKRAEAAEARATEAEAVAARCLASLSSDINVVIGNQTNIAQQNITVTINAFNNEAIMHIGPAQIKEVLDRALTDQPENSVQAAMNAMMRAAMLIYSDPEHPENLTCFLPNKKKDEAMVYVDRGGKKRWEIQSCNMVIPPMATKTLSTLFTYQPFENADHYGELMLALANNEKAYKDGREMRTILVRNKQLLEQVLEGSTVATA